MSDLETSVITLLFTDRTAPPEFKQPYPGFFDRRGWWGDTYSTYQAGSHLWLLKYMYGANNLLQQARNFATVALQPLLDYGIVSAISVKTSWAGSTQWMNLDISLTEPVSNSINRFQYTWAWQQVQQQFIPSSTSGSTVVINPPGTFDQSNWDQAVWS